MSKSLRITIAFLLAIFAQGAFAQEAHWTVNPHDFRYDMSAYFALTVDEVAVTDYTDYEIAAFVGDECRGVAKIQSATKNDQTVYFASLRIYSNVAEGENITFKVWVKSDATEIEVEEYSLPFVAESVVGMPSSPVMLSVVKSIPGDPDGDGEVTISDVTLAIQVALGNEVENFNMKAADLDGDGEITIEDVILMIRLALEG